MAHGPHITVHGDVIGEVSGFPVTNVYLTSVLGILTFFYIAQWYKGQIEKDKKSSLFYVFHGVFMMVYRLFENVMGRNIGRYFPLLGAFFVYILWQNWFGLFPGVVSVTINPGAGYHDEFVPLLRGANTDLNTTLALALIAVFMVQYYGVKDLGAGYFGKFFNFKGPMSFVIGIIELVSEISRILSFTFRLYGNIFAGKVLLSVMAFLIPVFVPFPFFTLEILVGVIQAFVFSMLTAIFIQMAVNHAH